jgi:hypothetical protein
MAIATTIASWIPGAWSSVCVRKANAPETIDRRRRENAVMHINGTDVPDSGTLLELTTLLAGDLPSIRLALTTGYRLTGNFRGHEAEVVADLDD